MKSLVPIALCFLIAGTAMAQRRGGGMGGARGPVGIQGGGPGGFRGGYGGGFRGGSHGGFGLRGSLGFRGTNRAFLQGGFHDGYGARFGLYGGYYLPYSVGYWGPGLGWPSYFSYPYAYDSGYGYGYSSAPNVTVVYAQPQEPASSVLQVERARPVIREYAENGQEVRPAAEQTEARSPIYLIALKDRIIHAASAYWVEGRTLHYVTLQREEKQVALDSIDRELSLQLNSERRVPFKLP